LRSRKPGRHRHSFASESSRTAKFGARSRRIKIHRSALGALGVAANCGPFFELSRVALATLTPCDHNALAISAKRRLRTPDSRTRENQRASCVVAERRRLCADVIVAAPGARLE
jgi:hypothetical protein